LFVHHIEKPVLPGIVAATDLAQKLSDFLGEG
jgi:hypothetical protein